MSALTVTIHALLIARAQVQEDRDVQFNSSVNPSTGVVEGESESAWIAGYDATLATIDEAIERAKKEPVVTLRDHFAAEAMSTAWTVENAHPTGSHSQPTYAGIAARAYLMADAMLKARAAP